MKIQLEEVIRTSQLKKFVRFPYQLYKNCEQWVPPLERDELTTLHWHKNPSLKTAKARYWLAKIEGKYVGRVAGIALENEDKVRFGWIDFIEDIEVCRTLLDVVEKWGRHLGKNSIHGPFGFTDFDFQGMLIKGFLEFGTITTIYNYPYYPKMLEKLGFSQGVEWVEKTFPLPDKVQDKIVKMAHWSEEKFGFRNLEFSSKNQMLKRAEDGLQVLNESYKSLYGFHPFTKEQSDYYIKQYFNFAKRDMISLVADEDDRIVGFGLVMPTLGHAFKKANGHLFPFGFIPILKALFFNNEIDLFIIGVLPEHQRKGVNAIVVNNLLEAVIKRGVKRVYTNPAFVDNKVLGLWKIFEGERDYRWRCCFYKDFK